MKGLAVGLRRATRVNRSATLIEKASIYGAHLCGCSTTFPVGPVESRRLHLWLNSTTEKTHLNWPNLWDLLNYTAMTLNKDCPEGSELKYNNIKSSSKRLKSRKNRCPDAGAGAFKLAPAAACWGGKMQNSWADPEKAGAANDTAEDGMTEWKESRGRPLPPLSVDPTPVTSKNLGLDWKYNLPQTHMVYQDLWWNQHSLGPRGRRHTHKTVQASALLRSVSTSIQVRIVSIATINTPGVHLYMLDVQLLL